MAAADDIIKAIEDAKPFAIRASVTGHGMKKGDVWIISPMGKYHVGRDTLNGLYFSGQIQNDPNGQPPIRDPKSFADIPEVAS
jgi:hypothetical protein